MRASLGGLLVGLVLACGASAQERDMSGPTQEPIVITPTHRVPHPGKIFTGVFMRIAQPADVHVFSLTCTVHLGGRIVVRKNIGVAFAGGVYLRPILHRYYTAPDAAGRRYLWRVTCGWRLPKGSGGKLLSLLPRPRQIPCDTSCPPTGFDVSWGASSASEPCCFQTMNQTTWRIRRSR